MPDAVAAEGAARPAAVDVPEPPGGGRSRGPHADRSRAVDADPSSAVDADPSSAVDVDRLSAVADAVLYEGYLLYPYRRSSPKNRVRWQFGVLLPRDRVERDGPVTPGVSGAADSWYQRTECLVRLRRPDAAVTVRVRFLHQQHKQVQQAGPDGGYHPVDSLRTADGTAHLTFDEAVPREARLTVAVADLLRQEHTAGIGAAAGQDTEPLPSGAGRVVRRREEVRARTVLTAERLAPDLVRLRVRTENTGTSPDPAAPRDEALRRALIATHTLIGGTGVEFVSLIDPPAQLAEHARGCRNAFTFPVLGGAPAGAPEGEGGLGPAVLSSPILLPDRPQVAPESPGDLHDAAEIDEILTLRTMLLTDAEKAEARATDPRAADILDRVETLPTEVFARLHGAIRSLAPAAPDPSAALDSSDAPDAAEAPAAPRVPAAPEAPGAAERPAWWQELGGDGLSPTTDTVLVDGVRVGGGSRVRLRPRRGADAQDMFLAGRTARVAGVFHDVEGGVHLAVTVDDDPAAELHTWYGRFHYFRPDELVPLEPSRPPAPSP
ncbi:hypothetical protein [Streptomyces mexicanus]|uniref:hypothetical protein n=1 Tax=Streptomyces mexicanus TaxID=178566 RepID=UPI0036C16205